MALKPHGLTENQLDTAYRNGLRTLTEAQTPGLINLRELGIYNAGWEAAFTALGYKLPIDTALLRAKEGNN